MTERSAVPAVPPRRSWLLMVSLALNLLIAGAVAGAVVLHPRNGPPWGGRGGNFGTAPYDPLNFGRALGGPSGFKLFMATLPTERRAALKPLVDRAHQTIRPLRLAAQGLREAALAATTAEPFDSAKVERSIADLVDAESTTRRAVAHAFAEVMSQLTREERAQFVAWRRSHEPPAPPPPPPASLAAPPEPPVAPAPPK